MTKRLGWFDEGAPHLRTVLSRLGRENSLPDDRDYYACPCCLQAFPREAMESGLLTEEHVPPERLGGKPLVLTCDNCNKRAGYAFDSQAARRAQADDFARGRVTGDTLPVIVHADGIPLRGTIERTEDGLRIIGIREQNDPRIQAAHMAALDAFVERGDPQPNLSFTVQTHFSETRARYSWIRAAYLAAFAALGWAYILRPVMQPIRDQLANPDAEVLPTYMFRDPESAPSTRRILLVSEPDELRCVAAWIGEFAVFLPSVFNPMTMDELSQAFAGRCDQDQRLEVTLSGKEAPWPSRARYLLDR